MDPMRFLTPLGAENKWSDLLASLIEADPVPVGDLLGLGADLHDVVVHREAPAGGRDRIDLVITVAGEQRCIAEAKVLSGLGTAQLERYSTAHPRTPHRVLISPELLPIPVAAASGWRSVHWEHLLTAFTRSTNAWVAQTAARWLSYVDATVPRLSADTRWNDLSAGDDFVLALRSRMSWVYRHLAPSPPMEYDLVSSAAGRSWVTRLYTPAQIPGYVVSAEAEERLSVREYPKRVGEPGSETVQGPSVKVSLVQTDVTTSAGFDWDYLRALWPTMAAARSDWVTTTARPKAAHDREAWRQMVAAGGPAYLGIGFGENQAKSSGACMFGARFQLPADSALASVAAHLNATSQLVQELAALPYRPARLNRP